MSRGAARWGGLVAWAAAVACTPSGSTLDDGLRSLSPLAPACPDGFGPSDAGAGCDAIVPEGPCAPGTMPTMPEMFDEGTRAFLRQKVAQFEPRRCWLDLFGKPRVGEDSSVALHCAVFPTFAGGSRHVGKHKNS